MQYKDSDESLGFISVAPTRKSFRTLIAVASSISCTFAGLLLIPLMPWLPMIGLDSSWCYALNEAIAHNLVFGRDVIFTFGPLASVYTSLYHPATDAIMLFGSAVVAVGFCALHVVLAGKDRKWILIALPLAVACSESRDAIFLTIPVLLIFAGYKVYGSTDRSISWQSRFGLSLGCIAVAVLPLVKGSFAGMSFAQLGLCFIFLIWSRRIADAVALCAISTLTLICGWCLSGQPLMALPKFFFAQRSIISGYTEAMSTPGPISAVVFFLIAAAVLICCLYFGSLKGAGRRSSLLLLGTCLAFFIIFKAGFVRQDGHVLASAEAFLFFGYAIGSLVRGPTLAITLVAAVFGWITIENTATEIGPYQAYARIASRFDSSYEGAKLRLFRAPELKSGFENAEDKIRKDVPLPTVHGTADVYPTELSVIFANDIAWAPRPIIQSYSAYTPALDARNAEHLAGPFAPDNVFLSVESIDNRLPTLEDAHSWPILLSRYSIRQNLGNRLWLTRNPGAPAEIRFGPQMTSTTHLGERLSVPFRGPIWSSIDIRPNLLGSAIMTVFKTPPLQMELTLSDGSIVSRRVIPNMARGGFLISPYIGSEKDFSDIAAGEYERKRVVSIRLSTPTQFFWNREIAVVFHELELPTHRGSEPVASK